MSKLPLLSRGFYECIADLKTKNNFVVVLEGDTYRKASDIKVCGLMDFLEKHSPVITQCKLLTK